MRAIPFPQLWPSATSSPIRVVGPNPAMDRLIVVTELHPGGVHRASRVVELAGGKSFIIARSLRRLGVGVAVYGFLGGPVGDFVARECRALGALDRHTPISGSSRITPVIIEKHTGRSTVLNEPGPEISTAELDGLRFSVQDDLSAGDIVVCTGSVPRGVPNALYAETVRAARAVGAFSIVDASGDLLAAALGEAPWLVKCNATEFAALHGCAVHDVPSLIHHMRGQVDSGSTIVIITRGSDATLVATADGFWQVGVPAIPVVNATGSGDTFLACLVAAIARGADLSTALTDATVGGALNASRLEAGLPDRPDLSSWREDVAIDPLLTEVR